MIRAGRDGLIDALRAQPQPRLPGEPLPQVAADLVRAPALRQQFADDAPQLGAGVDPAAMVPCSSGGCPTVRPERAMALRRCRVAAQLTRDRRRSPAQPASDLTLAGSSAVEVSDLNALILGQEPRADLADRVTVPCRHEADDLAGPVRA